MSLEKVQIPSQRPIYPTPAGLVTTVEQDGNPNIITLGEIYNLSIRKPVIVGLGIAPQRYSHQLLCECREFVVNLPTSALPSEPDTAALRMSVSDALPLCHSCQKATTG